MQIIYRQAPVEIRKELVRQFNCDDVLVCLLITDSA